MRDSMLRLLNQPRSWFRAIMGRKRLETDMDTELTEFLSPAFGNRTAMLIASALVGAAMHWRHQAPKSPVEPIITDIVAMLVEGVTKRRL